jgi:hypothetical protein
MADSNRFAGFKQRLARSAAGVSALFTDESVREKTGALLQRKINDAVEKGSSGLRGVLAKVAEVDALRALRRRAGDEDPALIDLQVSTQLCPLVPWWLARAHSHTRPPGRKPRVRECAQEDAHTAVAQLA